MARTPRGDFHHPVTDAAIGFAWDGGAVSWAPSLEHNPEFEGELIAGGYLFGKPVAVGAVRQQLRLADNRVRLAEGVFYTFTEERDTLPDLLAAMIVTGSGRGELTQEGWDALEGSPGAVVYEPEPDPGAVLDLSDSDEDTGDFGDFDEDSDEDSDED